MLRLLIKGDDGRIIAIKWTFKLVVIVMRVLLFAAMKNAPQIILMVALGYCYKLLSVLSHFILPF